MAEATGTEDINGVDNTTAENRWAHKERETLQGVVHRTMTTIFFPEAGGSPFVQRIKASLSENAPLLKEASANTGRELLIWTRRGSPFRALFVISVGTIAFLSLTGLLVFMLFFLAATVNAIIISLLFSLAAAGSFLAFFFACVTAVYIGALSVAIFVISTATISAIAAALIATGWIGFFWTVWLVTKKSVGAAKHSLIMTGSAISAYSFARHAPHHRGPVKVLN
uniref:Uncharacterized protein n=1 Tax=Rhizophora mucronata TaxID=61149 RepID=A0A2P2JLZ5_RHIMU